MWPHLNILPFSLKLFELPITEMLTVNLHYHSVYYSFCHCSSFWNLFTHVYVYSSFPSHFVFFCTLSFFLFFWLSSFPSQWVTRGIFETTVSLVLPQSKSELLLCSISWVRFGNCSLLYKQRLHWSSSCCWNRLSTAVKLQLNHRVLKR